LPMFDVECCVPSTLESVEKIAPTFIHLIGTPGEPGQYRYR
jgi:hypothetical protein